MALPNGLTIPPSNDVVSPELALVDPVLAERARSWLPEREDTLVRLERLVRARRIAASRAGQAESLGIPVQAQLAPRATPSTNTSGHRRSAALAGSMAAGVLVAAMLVGVRIDLSGSPAEADTTVIGEPPAVTGPETVPSKTVPKTPVSRASAPPAPARHGNTPRSSGRSRPTKAAAPQRFAWAPVAGASGYHVEFFRGRSLVFSTDTKRPEVSIPASWSLRGRRQRLDPGEYRWYVWARHSGLRASGAVVQAKLVVPPR